MRFFHYNQEHHQNADNYLAFLIGLFALIIWPVFSLLPFPDRLVFLVLETYTIITGLYVTTKTKKELVTGLIIAVLAASITLVAVGTDVNEVDMVARLLSTAYFLFISSRLAIYLFEAKKVGLNMVFAALCGYLLIGTIGSELFGIAELIFPGSINVEHPIRSYDFIYFTYITQSTIGYGDIAPLTPPAKAISLLVGLVSQFYLTIIVALVVSKYATQIKD